MIEGEASAEFAARDFAGFFYHNPGARIVWKNREEYLERNRLILDQEMIPETWTETVNIFLSKLDNIQPPKDGALFVDW